MLVYAIAGPSAMLMRVFQISELHSCFLLHLACLQIREVMIHAVTHLPSFYVVLPCPNRGDLDP